jgi:DNA-binding protein WhiA
MSFASNVKGELCKNPVQKSCCALAECYGILLYCNQFSATRVRIVTGNRDVAERIPWLFRRALGVEFDQVTAPEKQGRHTFLMDDPEKIAGIFDALGFDVRSAVTHHINRGLLEEDCCRVAFLRGAFLAGGSITDPAKRYHMEFVTGHLSVSREAYTLFLDLGFAPKETTRGGNYLIYFKQSEAIEDLLTLLGASGSAMEVMSTKVEKDMRNVINRKVNCDSANADKVVAAAQEQIEAIRRIDRELGLENLPEKLQETALLRIANPEASLADLAMLSDPPVSKSCLNHRLKKLLRYCDQP